MTKYATTSDIASATEVTTARSRTKSPIPPPISRNGRNDDIATSVEVSSGIHSSPTPRADAVARSSPARKRCSMLSTDTIPASTTIPSAMIRARIEIWLTSTASKRTTPKVSTIVSTTVAPTSSPLRQPMNSATRPVTMATASSRLSAKSAMRSSTLRGWSAISAACVPAGQPARSRASRARTSGPRSVSDEVSLACTASATPARPSTRTSSSGGSG